MDAKPVTLLRGDALLQRLGSPNVLHSADAIGTAAIRDRTLDIAHPSTDTIYGIPASAIQSCCGRGCKHCRIYWYKSAI
jgi:hypothetical protein